MIRISTLSAIKQMNRRYTFVIDFWRWIFILNSYYADLQDSSIKNSICLSLNKWINESWIYFYNWLLMLNFYDIDLLRQRLSKTLLKMLWWSERVKKYRSIWKSFKSSNLILCLIKNLRFISNSVNFLNFSILI